MCQEGRISQAARLKKDQAEQMEEMYEIPAAAKCYKEAGNLFEKDDASSQANQMYVKSADLAATAENPDWAEIIQTYEKIIAAYLRKGILKISAKSLLFKVVHALVTYDDVVGAEIKFDLFCFDDPIFQG